ncbi:MAG: hypothetical protein AAGC60_01655 [Acidobacteriota bacterium]
MTSLVFAFVEKSPHHPLFPAIGRPEGLRQAGRERFLRRLISLELQATLRRVEMPQGLAQAFVAGDSDRLEAELGALGLERAEPWLDLVWRQRAAICLETLSCLVPRARRGDLRAARLALVWPILETSAREGAESILADMLGLDWLATHLDPEATWDPRELLDELSELEHDLSLQLELVQPESIDVLPLAA